MVQKCDVASGPYHRSGDKRAFCALISELGLSNAELARRLGVHPNMVSRWSLGRTKTVPGPVMAYLRLYRDVRAIVGR